MAFNQSDDRTELARLISDIALRFINIPQSEVDSGITRAMGEIASAIGANRGTLYIYSDNESKAIPRYEWTMDEAASPLRRGDVLDRHIWGDIFDSLKKGEVVSVPTPEDIRPHAPEVAAMLDALGVVSGFATPLSNAGGIVGFVSLVFARKVEMPDETTLALLAQAAGIISNLLARQRMERQLRRSEEHRRLALEAGKVVTWELDVDTQRLTWLDNLNILFTETNRGFIGSLSEYFDLIHPDDVAKVRLIYAKTLEDKIPFSTEHRIVRDSGEVHWISVRGMPHFARDGSADRLLGTVADITDRRNTEIHLKFRMDFENLITSISTRFINLPVAGMDDGVRQALKEVAEFARMNQGYVFLFDDEGLAHCRYEWCNDRFEPQIGVLQNLDLIKMFPWYYERISQREPVVIPSVSDMPTEAGAIQAELQREGIESLIDVPMVSGDRLIGFLGFASIHREVKIAPEVVPIIRIMGEIVVNLLDRLSRDTKLQRSESDRRAAQRMAKIGSWEWDIINNTIRWTDEVHNLFAVPSGEMAMKYEEFLAIVHPDDRDRFAKAVDTALNERGNIDEEIRTVQKNGVERYVHEFGELELDSSGNPVRMIGTVQDISERVESEKLIHENERKFRTLFESAADAIFILKNGMFVQFNAPTLKMFGCTSNQIFGKSPAHFSPEIQPDGSNSREEAEARMKKASAANPQLFEWQHVRPDGTPFEAEVRLNRMDLPEGDFLQAIVRDITDKKRAAELAEKQKEQLFHASKMISLGTLVSGFAHEVNNPNNFIRLNIQGLSEFISEIYPILDDFYDRNPELKLQTLPYPRSKEMIDEMVHGVLEGSYRIEKLVDDLKGFAREQRGDLNQSFALNKAADSAVKLVGAVIHKATADFEYVPGEIGGEIRGDRHQIEQVMINLLTNACQALESRDQAVRLSTGYGPGRTSIYIRVEDQGPGIPEEDLPYITDPFFSTKRESGGTGLGLSMSYQIVKDHGGDISFRSATGSGTVAEVVLPL